MTLCGLSEVEITPPLNCAIPGYLKDRFASGIKDPLFAKALVIESDGTAAAIIVLDALYALRPQADKIRQRVAQATSIPVKNILVSATHTHTGPPIRPARSNGEVYAEYLQCMVERAADAAILAFNKREEAFIGFGSGRENDIAFNRRLFMKDGTVKTNPGYDSGAVDYAGPVDPEVTVVRIDRPNGEPLGVVSNFACHTDTVSGAEYCADYPGTLSATLKKVLGQDVVSLFILGACGNINHLNFLKPKNIRPLHYQKMGRILAGEIIRVREKIILPEEPGELPLAVNSAHFTADLISPTPEQLNEAQCIIDNPESTFNETYFANSIIKTADETQKSTEVEIQTLSLDDLAISGLPAEIFVEFGLQIKEKSPFKFNIIDTLCNGSTTGYICTREAYEQGGYEPYLGPFNRNAHDTGERIAQSAIDLLHASQPAIQAV